MSDTIYKNCRDCGERIQLSRMPNGNWVAFDPGTGKHECSGASVPVLVPVPVAMPTTVSPSPNRASSPTYYQREFDAPAPNAMHPMGCVGSILFVIVVAALVFLTWLFS